MILKTLNSVDFCIYFDDTGESLSYSTIKFKHALCDGTLLIWTLHGQLVLSLDLDEELSNKDATRLVKKFTHEIRKFVKGSLGRDEYYQDALLINFTIGANAVGRAIYFAFLYCNYEKLPDFDYISEY